MNTLFDFLLFTAWVLVPSLAMAGGLRFLAWLAGAEFGDEH